MSTHLNAYRPLLSIILRSSDERQYGHTCSYRVETQPAEKPHTGDERPLPLRKEVIVERAVAIGDPGRARTFNPEIKSLLLYH
jgi:hypothetical protein